MRLLHAACFAGVAFGVAAVGLSSTTGCSSATQVRQVYMALDGAGTRPRNIFFTDTTSIFCDVQWSGRNPDSTLQVLFEQTSGETPMFSGTGTLGPVNRVWAGAETVPGLGESPQSFSMTAPSSVEGGGSLPFPVGAWKCVVSVNGESAGETDFTIEYPSQYQNQPDCPPDGVATNGLSCDAYLLNAQCPSVAAFNVPTDCTCTGAQYPRFWICNTTK